MQRCTSDEIATGGQGHAEAHVALNDGNLSWSHTHAAEFCGYVKCALLRNEEQVAVSVVERPARHAAVGQVLVHSDARFAARVTSARDSNYSVDEIHIHARAHEWVPSALIGRCRRVRVEPAHQQRVALVRLKLGVLGGGQNAEEPSELIGGAGAGESGSGQLFTVETHGAALRVVLYRGHGTCDSLRRDVRPKP